MTERRDASDRRDEATSDGAKDETGDPVEAAGETTASALIGGDDDTTRPVGADTQVRVEGDTHPADG